MSIKSIIDAIEDGIATVEKFKGLAATLGIPLGPILEIAKSVTEVASNIADRAAEAGEVLSSDDEARIEELTTRLAAVNDDLAKAIDAS